MKHVVVQNLRFIKLEPTRTDRKPSRTYQESSRNPLRINQNHARIDQETTSLLHLFIPAHSFFMNLYFPTLRNTKPGALPHQKPYANVPDRHLKAK